MSTIIREVTLFTDTCINCGITFAYPSSLNQTLRESHRDFFCPNGHAQHYTGESEAEKLRKQLARARADVTLYKDFYAEEREVRERTERRLSATRGVVTRTKNRIARGVCPCCNRHFENLHRHMTMQHPEYAAEEKG